jgi:hypothetical protein
MNANEIEIRSLAVVTAHTEGGKTFFKPGVFVTQYGSMKTRPLMYDEDECAVEFDNIKDAETVVYFYNRGPSEDCRRARWDTTTGNWEELEHDSSKGRGGREDFHADG